MRCTLTKFIKYSAVLTFGIVLPHQHTLTERALAQQFGAAAPLPSPLGPHSASPPAAYYDRTQDPLNDRMAPADRRRIDLKLQGSNKNITDPGLIDNGRDHDLSLRIVDYMEESKALPIEHATAIVAATLVASHGFVGGDHTSVYSEHQFDVEEVLKSDDPALVPGAHAVATREGGTVRFPSGHLKDYIIEGQGIPKVGVRYLLFLWRGPDAHELNYGIDTAYELGADSKVYVLDFVKPYTQYEGVEQADVFAAIRRNGGGH
jgi:hypothetical protein